MSQVINVICKENQTILDVCRERNVLTKGTCGGVGLCGKCKIRVIRGEVPATKKDETFFTKEELEKGFRLACMAHPLTPCDIEVFSEPDEMQIVTEYGALKERYENTDGRTGNGPGEKKMSVETVEDFRMSNKTLKHIIAVDIGTTTVAMQLLELTSQEDKEDKEDKADAYGVTVKNTCGVINEQRNYGADVLSRIKASVDGKGRQQKECIQRILADGIIKLTEGLEDCATKTDTGIIKNKDLRSDTIDTIDTIDTVDTIVIAGNTTMIHLLMGYSCETLGVAPFKPVTTRMIKSDADKFFLEHIYKSLEQKLSGTKVLVFPGISAFAGGDMVAGLYETGIADTDQIQMFVDLGTNAEMAIGSRRRLLVTSAAAGPAFEGGGIACGTASVNGAICEASLLKDGSFRFKTIGDASPVGICGTGLIEIISELFQAGRLDETGLLDEGKTDTLILSEKENIYLTQKDIRTFQMAKAAICAGIQTLIQQYGTDVSKIERVYIAGGFGYYLNIQKAATIGLFPKELQKKIVPVGNTVLSGIRSFVKKKNGDYELEKIRKMATEINLAGDEYFKESYLQNMYFPDGKTC